MHGTRGNGTCGAPGTHALRQARQPAQPHPRRLPSPARPRKHRRPTARLDIKLSASLTKLFAAIPKSLAADKERPGRLNAIDSSLTAEAIHPTLKRCSIKALLQHD